jgi:hypothetical protein
LRACSGSASECDLLPAQSKGTKNSVIFVEKQLKNDRFVIGVRLEVRSFKQFRRCVAATGESATAPTKINRDEP